MKTKLLFLPLFVVLASCINEDTLLNESLDNVNESFQYYVGNCRSFEEVVEIAESSISMLQESSVETRGAGRRTLNLKDGVKFLCKSTTRANNNGLDVDTLLYVFNFNDDQGFAIVSANRNTTVNCGCRVGQL